MKLTPIFLLVLLSLNAYAGISIVSDLDDTIKITNSGNLVRSGYRAVFKKEVFTGMPEFLESSRRYANELHIVTASPDVLRPKVRNTLESHGIKYESINMRGLRNASGKFEFKVKTIKEIMEKNSDDFIFFGDDVGQDPEVYVELKKLFPERVLGTYIRVITNREIPDSVQKYYSTHDIAIFENLAGRMSSNETDLVLDSLLKEERFSMTIPYFAHCPEKTNTVWVAQSSTEFALKASEITDRLNNFCEKREGQVIKMMETSETEITPY